MTRGSNAAVLRMLEGSFAVAAGAWLLRLARALGGVALQQRLVHAIDVYGIRSGWPAHPAGWINLHVSRWLRRARRRAAGVRLAPRHSPPRRPGPWRVGIVGSFAGLLSFPRQLFIDIPGDIDVHIFDVAYHGRAGTFLRPLVTSYVELALDDNLAAATSDAVAQADVDLLMVIGPRGDTYDLLDVVQARTIMNYCTGSDLMYHERLDFQMHGQPQADYFVKDRRMFCGLTRRPFTDSVVLPIETGFYDPRGLDLATARSWAERDPLIVFHGSLYKVAYRALLDRLLNLLADDRAIEFVIMGRDDGRSLARIRQAASARGVAGRVHYEGAFNSVRGADGEVADEGWGRLVALLGRARLAPDPFPVGGGSSRFEAYALGAPSVHLGVRFDQPAWGKPQPAACDVVFLNTRAGTAYDVDAYERLCRQCFQDAAFADALADEQRAIAARLIDSRTRWERLRRTHDDWRRN
jgi:hypothetical protein